MFRPGTSSQSYRLPRDAQERLTAALAPFRNRDSAFALAVFLARFWSVPGRIAGSFPIDRRELADREDLGLTEDRVRGAIKTLEEIGFLDRALTSGSKYKPTEDGLRRKPVLFQFGSDYAPMFIAANRRAAARRERDSAAVRTKTLVSSRRASTVKFQASLNSPKSKTPSERTVLMGEVVKESGIPPLAFDPDSSVDAALARLWQGIRQSRGG